MGQWGRTKGKLGTGIDILIKVLKNRLTKIIEQMPKTGAFFERFTIHVIFSILDGFGFLSGTAHYCR